MPSPQKEETFNAMSGAYLFSCFDLLNGYYQQLLREKDIPYTAFTAANGHWEYLVSPQGLCGVPGSFNRLVDAIFQKVQDSSNEEKFENCRGDEEK